ncbi:MAG: peptidoglycan-binding protein, partial [Dactylosporangium sp.]|nr:peptidoglycan-binding protein [Dactylosporangium sp.]NNJ63496.1 peptidoglycan-binding protein [Dactylosporangium sp.]
MSRDVPRTHHPVTRPRRRGRVLTALTALITLMALVVGAPVLLIEVAGNPLPDHPPTIDETLNLLTSPDNGTLFLRLLAVVAWASWATFVVSVGVEIPATIRRRPSPRLVGLGLQQRLAATLIATIGLMAHAPAVASAATAHPITQPRPPAAVATVPTPPISSDVHQARPVYEVRAGDWLGHVAARYLGDFNRYREIAACNPDLVAADRRFPDHIEATWHIVLPADAQDRGRRPHATGHLVESVPTAPTAPDRPEPTTPQPAEPEIPTSPAPSAPRQPAPGVTAPTPAPATTPNPS